MQESINSQSMLKVGTILRGIYRIDSYLSSGGFGNTYVATNIEFDERVAIKEFFMKGVTQRDNNQTTVSVSNAENRDSFLEQREKFKKEARRLRRLNNPHIVSVHDLFEEHGTAYYVMDYIDSENLAERLKRTGKPMTEAEVNQILPQILDALKSVHDTGIWHLDLKPANIMVDKSGQVKLIDFGASKQLNAQKGGATTSTAISYTNGYAPREQMEQNYDKFGPWTDIYALGATLYNLLTNKRPPLPMDIDDDISEDKHLALPMPNVSNAMKNLVLWMMKTNCSQRPQKADAILERGRSEDTIIKRVYPKHSGHQLLPEETEATPFHVLTRFPSRARWLSLYLIILSFVLGLAVCLTDDTEAGLLIFYIFYFLILICFACFEIDKQKRWGLIDKAGNVIIPPKYDGMSDFSEGMAKVQRCRWYLVYKCGYIDKMGKIVISLKYDEASDFLNGLAKVKRKGKWGCIDRTGNIIIPLRYDDMSDFHDGLAKVKRYGKWGCIDKSGNTIIPLKHDRMSYLEKYLKKKD